MKILSDEMVVIVTNILIEGTKPDADGKSHCVPAKDLAAVLSTQLNIPEEHQADFKLLITQAVKLGEFPGFESVRGRFGGIRKVKEE